MKFKEDSPIHQFLHLGSKFILLNFLYIISCLPIITIGIATTSLMSTTLNFAINEDEALLKNYLKSWKDNWKKGSISFGFLFLITTVLLFVTIFWISFNSQLGYLLGFITAVLFIYLVISLCFSLALIARYDNPLLKSISLSLRLPLVNLVKSLGIITIIIVTLCSLYLFPFFKILFALMGFSFISYCLAFLISSVFKEIEPH